MAEIMTREEAIERIEYRDEHVDCKYDFCDNECSKCRDAYSMAIDALEMQIPKRVNGKGGNEFSEIDWKGMRSTRYHCPTCGKPVRNTDVFCHRCGQKLIFPKIKHSPYIQGEIQNMWIDWSDKK